MDVGWCPSLLVKPPSVGFRLLFLPLQSLSLLLLLLPPAPANPFNQSALLISRFLLTRTLWIQTPNFFCHIPLCLFAPLLSHSLPSNYSHMASTLLSSICSAFLFHSRSFFSTPAPLILVAIFHLLPAPWLILALLFLAVSLFCFIFAPAPPPSSFPASPRGRAGW